jgi:hypothetical protein
MEMVYQKSHKKAKKIHGFGLTLTWKESERALEGCGVGQEKLA